MRDYRDNESCTIFEELPGSNVNCMRISMSLRNINCMRISVSIRTVVRCLVSYS